MTYLVTVFNQFNEAIDTFETTPTRLRMYLDSCIDKYGDNITFNLRKIN